VSGVEHPVYDNDGVLKVNSMKVNFIMGQFALSLVVNLESSMMT
jgi:hypothetical protein